MKCSELSDLYKKATAPIYWDQDSTSNPVWSWVENICLALRFAASNGRRSYTIYCGELHKNTVKRIKEDLLVRGYSVLEIPPPMVGVRCEKLKISGWAE